MNDKKLNRLKQLSISHIKKNKKQRKEKKKNGEFFNVFSILKVERNEVYTHSAMLCELLDPNGAHGMGDEFLKLFLEEIPLRNKIILNTKKAHIIKEEFIGPINRKKETGGQIDILIEFKSPDYKIIIENKIDASDQEAQLARYYNYLISKDSEKNFTILYLTKFGNPPSDYSIGKILKENIPFWDCISYNFHIQEWLKKCIDVSSTNLPVKEILKQYSNLIDKITDKELDMTDNKKLIRKIYENELFETAEEFFDIWQQRNIFIAEIIADRLKDNDKDGWKHLDDYCESTTIFKLIDDKNCIYLFFEPKYSSLGFYGKKGLNGARTKLKQIIKKVSSNPGVEVQESEEQWCHIIYAYKDNASTTKNAINDYYNDIYTLLQTLENEYKNL